MRLPFFVVGSVLCLASFAHAQTPQAGWTADPKTGCRAWDLTAGPSKSISWRGACARGMAQGKGVLRWFKDGKPSAVEEGEWKDGYFNGRGVKTWAGGARYEGEWRDDKMNGRGVATSGDGRRYEGELKDGKADGFGRYTDSNGTYNGIWTAGCFKDGNRRMAFGISLEACP